MMKAFFLASLAMTLASCPQLAPAADTGAFGPLSDTQRAWFKSVKSPHGVSCCDVADGHPTEFDYSVKNASGYRIPNPASPDGKKEWMDVPPEAVVYDAGNPYGEAVVWYTMQDGVPYVRCFVPGGGV